MSTQNALPQSVMKVFFSSGATAPSGPGPPQSRGF